MARLLMSVVVNVSVRMAGWSDALAFVKTMLVLQKLSKSDTLMPFWPFLLSPHTRHVMKLLLPVTRNPTQLQHRIQTRQPVSSLCLTVSCSLNMKTC